MYIGNGMIVHAANPSTGVQVAGLTRCRSPARSALADPHATKAGRPRWWVAGLSSFLALVVAATLWLTLRDDAYVAPTPSPPRRRIQPAAAAALLQDLTERRPRRRRGRRRRARGRGRPGGAGRAARPRRQRRGDRAARLHPALPRRAAAVIGREGEWRAAADPAVRRFARLRPAPATVEVEVGFAVDGPGRHDRRARRRPWRDPGLADRPGRRSGARRTRSSSRPTRGRPLLPARGAAVTVVRRVLPGWRRAAGRGGAGRRSAPSTRRWGPSRGRSPTSPG